jgi:hypothetical protein
VTMYIQGARGMAEGVEAPRSAISAISQMRSHAFTHAPSRGAINRTLLHFVRDSWLRDLGIGFHNPYGT